MQRPQGLEISFCLDRMGAMESMWKCGKTTLGSSKGALFSVFHIFGFTISFQALKGILMLLLKKAENMVRGQLIDKGVLITQGDM